MKIVAQPMQNGRSCGGAHSGFGQGFSDRTAEQDRAIVNFAASREILQLLG